MIDGDGNETKTIYEAYLLEVNANLRGCLEIARALITEECSHLEIGHTVIILIDEALEP